MSGQDWWVVFIRAWKRRDEVIMDMAMQRMAEKSKGA